MVFNCIAELKRSYVGAYKIYGVRNCTNYMDDIKKRMNRQFVNNFHIIDLILIKNLDILTFLSKQTICYIDIDFLLALFITYSLKNTQMKIILYCVTPSFE